MPIANIGRNVNQVSLTTTATLGPDVELAYVNATSAGFTVTLTDFEDNAFHEVAFVVDPADVSGNDVTISGNAGSFSASVSSNGATSIILRTQYDGTWYAVGDVSSTDAAAANSRAVSAGLQGSTASSANTSQSILISTADSKAVSNSVVTSTLTTTTNSAIASLSSNLSVTTSTANSG